MAIKFGTPGADALTGEDSFDLLFGFGGNDRLDAVGDGDAVFGGDGNDTLFGGASDDAVLGGAGDDSIVGDASGGGPNPVARGGDPGRNLLLGGDGADTIRGGYGRDTAFGGSGDDTIIGWGFGPPSPSGSEAFEALDDADALWGGGGNDSIRGGGGADRLGGGRGDDTLQGGYGLDILTGGKGADRFVFGREGIAGEVLDGGVGAGNRDVVTDFDPCEDVLDLSGYRSFFLPLGTPSPVFVGADPFRADPVGDGYRLQVRYEIEGDRTIVQVYSPFNAPPPELDIPPPKPTATVEIELRGVHGLSADDVFLG